MNRWTIFVGVLVLILVVMLYVLYLAVTSVIINGLITLVGVVVLTS